MPDDTRYFKRYAAGKFVASWEAPDEWTQNVREAVRQGFELRIVFKDDDFRGSLERAGVPADVIARIVETLRLTDDTMAVDRPYT